MSGATSVTEACNSSPQATIGELVTYTVTATIPEGSTVYGASAITDVVDARLSIQGTPTFTVRGGAPQNATLSGNTITAPLTTPFANPSGSGDDLVVLTFTARVLDASGPVRTDVVPNRATFGWANQAGQASSVTSARVDVTIVEPDLSILKSSDAVGGQVVGGQLVTYTLALANGSGANVSTAHDVVVTDTVPSSIQPTDAGGNLVTANATLPGGGVWNQAARTITFTQSSLAPATSQNLTYQAKVVDPVISGSTIVNIATALATSLGGPATDERSATSAAGGPGSGYQSTSNVTLRVPGIAVAKSVTPTPRTIGERATYTLTVTIPANTIAYDVTVLDTLPTGVKFSNPVSVGCVQGGSACSPNVTAVVVGNTETDSPIGFFLGDLGTAASGDRVVTITYDGIMTPAAIGTTSVVNTATPVYNRTDTISGTPGAVPAASSFDTRGSSSSATIAIVEPLLTVDKLVGGQIGDSDARRAKPGETLTYTVAVTNSGTSPAWDVNVVDTPDLRLTGFTSTPPAGVIEVDTNPSDGSLAWNIPGPIAVGDTVTISYSLTVPPLANTAANAPSRTVANTVDVPHYFGVDPALQVSGVIYADYDNVTADTVTVRLDLASIGDLVWFDVDGDGTRDAGEPGLAGINVAVVYAGVDGLFGTSDDETVVVTTDSNGAWLAGSLPGGNYRVTVDAATLPAGVTPSYDLDGGAASANGVWQGTLASDAAKRDVDFGYTGTGSIGDRVWFDQNADGVQDATEPGLPGATVTVVFGGPDGNLATTADNITYVTTTGTNGSYLAERLAAGPYSVTVSGLPVGYGVVSDPAGGTSNSSTVNLAAGVADLAQDFGYAGTASIGDFVWLDRDGDGVQDGGEIGIKGASVTLTWLGVDGVAGGGDDAVFTTTTDDNGLYLFDNLLPGAYSVAVVGGLPAAVTNSFDRDGNNNSVTPVTVAAGDSIRDVDFGYDAVSVIGDRVWWDLDSDGVQNPAEPGLVGVSITVTYLGTDGVAGGGDDRVFTTVTGANGNWAVKDVPDGAYTVRVTSGVPAGFAPTFDADSGTTAPDGVTALTLVGSDLLQDFGYSGSSSLGDRLWLDLNGDGNQDANEPGLGGVTVTLTWFGPDGVVGGGDDVALVAVTNGAGGYRFSGLPAGTFSVTVDEATLPAGLVESYDLDDGLDSTVTVVLGADAALDTVDFGYVGTGVIGDTVWLDQNGDGIIDPTEPGLAEVTVTLTWAGLDGSFGTADDVVTVTTTDVDGAYVFEEQPTGLFSITLSGLPTGIAPTFDPDGGADGASRLSLAGGATNLNQDFGYRGTAGVGDLLWLDVDGDGTQTGNEPGLAGVVVTVRSPGADGIQGTPDDIVVVTTTDSSGRYRALGLPAGDVVVSYDPTTLPAGYVPASDLDGGSASSAVATLSNGGIRLDVDFIVVGNAALNGVVFDDVNGDGVRDPGDRGISGARVVVIWNGPVGPVTIIVTTDATGAW
uniref:beta strand repeat-containing protein n=1 Tax=Salinibacterium sp. TaxID=1915057 RepID=UPI00286D1290